jgi:hypothetical protein
MDMQKDNFPFTFKYLSALSLCNWIKMKEAQISKSVASAIKFEPAPIGSNLNFFGKRYDSRWFVLWLWLWLSWLLWFLHQSLCICSNRTDTMNLWWSVLHFWMTQHDLVFRLGLSFYCLADQHQTKPNQTLENIIQGILQTPSLSSNNFGNSVFECAVNRYYQKN